MRLLFWRAPKTLPSTDCTHLWSNWSEPVAIPVTVTVGYNTGATGEYDRLTQTRRCLHCNIYQRSIT